MTYTSHGYMTPADMADYCDLYDLDAREETCVDCTEPEDQCTCEEEQQ